MKHKLSLILAGLVISGTMAGCSASADSSQAAYISKDSARAAALAAAGIDASSANITSTQFSERDGIPYYEVDFTANGMSYSYSIDAVTGVIIESEDSKQQDVNVTDYDTLEVATSNTPVITDYDTANGGTASKNAAGTPAPAASAPAPAAGTAKEVTLDSAKQTALQHAGKSASEVSFVKAHKDIDDGRSIYEIEFVVQSGNSYQEYDYEIDASTGAIISSDFDAESYAPPKQQTAGSQPQQSTTKTEAEVRDIALAKVPGAKASDCSLWLDSDDGHLIYEGKIIYNQMEYEFDIDAYSGTILEWDAESIYD